MEEEESRDRREEAQAVEMQAVCLWSESRSVPREE